ncbi:ABC transporter permease [Corynebacterium caspium]|uniref:ABC transporter permease n=1 Tax=Corynebacterium caspium TaxID=234828 RepID=UPI00037C465A|nr:ABC transporter permease [Corynebacterium caspium]WKD58874.1 Glutathione transport system permease protein GsiC [Corynebacterium caspium DSM 44850]
MIFRIIARTLALLFASSVALFVLLRAIPGNPAEIALGLSATPETIAQRTQELGLDKSLWQQYWSWIFGLLQGDAGISLSSGTPIAPQLIEHGAVSLTLAGCTIIISLIAAFILGALAAQPTRLGAILSGLTQLGIAIPSFLMSILLVTIFAVHLGWLPPSGWVSPTENFPRFLARLILPVLSLSLVQTAILARYVRASLVESMAADYFRTALAMGATRTQALLRHSLRNAGIPVLTIAGIQLSAVLVGAVVVERVFVLPGLGSLLLSAVAARDLVIIQTLVLLLVVFTLVVTMIIEIITVLVDPRLRKAAK